MVGNVGWLYYQSCSSWLSLIGGRCDEAGLGKNTRKERVFLFFNNLLNFNIVGSIVAKLKAFCPQFSLHTLSIDVCANL